MHTQPDSGATAATPALFATYAPYPMPLQHGRGEEVFDAQQQAYLDLYGGYCVARTGHSHTAVAAAAARPGHQTSFRSRASASPTANLCARCVGALARQLGVSQSAVSQHLAVLRAAGLVADERRGYFVHYRLDRERLAACFEDSRKTLANR